MADTTDTRPKPYCFVLMPFSDEFDDVYELGIRASCLNAGAFCERVDEQIFQGTILERIYNQIARADFIVADMTGRNPNVFYEVGYAHALGKPTILLTQAVEDIPFDLRHFPHIVYQKMITALIEELTRRIRWFIENPMRGRNDGQIEIVLHLGQESLSDEMVVQTADVRNDLTFDITVENVSTRTMTPDGYGIGLIAPPGYSIGSNWTNLPNGDVMHMLSDMPTLFPSSCSALRFRINGLPEFGSRDRLTFRVFTDAGTRDFPLELERPSNEAARQRCMKRATEDYSAELRSEVMRTMAENWPDDDTRKFILRLAEETGPETIRSASLKTLVEKWPDDQTRDFVRKRYRDDPASACRSLALELLGTTYQDSSDTADLLREVVLDGPTGQLRGLAFSLLGGLHSEFGRRLATLNLNGQAPYLDPRDPLPDGWIVGAAERSLVPPSDIETVLAELRDHLWWNPCAGLRDSRNSESAQS